MSRCIESQSNRYIMDSAQREAGIASQSHSNGQEVSYYQSFREDSQRQGRPQDCPVHLPNQVPFPQMDTPPWDSGKSSQVSSIERDQCSTANRVDSEMQNDEKRSDFFVSQNNGGAWDPRNGAEPREAARAPSSTANTQSSSMTSRLRVAQSKGAEDSQQPWHSGSTTNNPSEEGGLPPSSSGVRWDIPQQHSVQSVIQRSSSGLAAMQQGSGNPTHPTQCSSVPGPNTSHGSNSHQSPGANQPSSLLAMQQPGAQHSNIPDVCRRHSWQTTSEDDGHSSSEHLLGAVGGREEPPMNGGARTTPRAPPLRLGLLGGGESSLNNGGSTSGWGAPPPGGPASGWGSGAPAGGTAQWGSAPGGPGRPGAQGQPGDYSVQGEGSTGLSPPKQGQQHNSWAQAAGKGLLPNQQGPQGNGTSGDQASSTSSASSSSSAVQQSGVMKPVIREEPISELRRAAAYSEGWGQTTINQESAWDAPPSPQPNPKDMPACPGPVWRAPANTGTEIWESSVRSRGKAGGAAGAQQGGGGASFYQGEESTQQQVWAPQMHIGGTWGEDDDEMSSANLWTGTPVQSGGGGGGNSGQGGPGNHISEGQSWNHHGQGEKPHWSGGPPKSANWGGDDHGGVPDNGTSVWGGGNGGPPKSGPGMPSGMPVGPQGPPPGPPGNASWSVPGPGGPPKRGPDPSTGWEEPPPPASRRPNFDDGTAVWGNPTRQGKVSHWKDMPSVRHQHEGKAISGGGPPPGMLRVPKEGGWGNKPGGRANWGGGENWGEDKGNWGEPTSPMGAPGYWGAKPKGPPNWADGQIDTSTWGGPAKQHGCCFQAGKPLTKDLICASKQFRLLTEMGYKKEDVENALRCNSMNLEDTLMDLQAMSRNDAMDGEFLRSGPKGMRGDDSGDQHGSGGPMEGGPPYAAPGGGFHGSPSGGFQGLPIFGAGYGAAQGFKPPVKGSGLNGNTATSLLSGAGMGGAAASAGGQNSSLSMGNSISSLSPALVHKILQQQQVQPPPFGPPAANAAPNPMGSQVGGRLGQPNVPSAAQLRLLVQQIQMAVHAGHLNPQILNQPLAPQTLQLLYQLLQQIKVLHALQQQQQVLHTKGGQPPLQLNVQLTQTKQRIVNLQNQIAAQQALFLKQQVQPPPQPPSTMEQPPPFLTTKPPNDPSGLHTDFRDLSLKDNSASQSRLNQWKLPTAPPTSFEEEPKNSQPQQNGEFSRAPGPASKAGPNGSSGLHPLLGHNDGPWSSRAQDSWPDTTSTTTTTSNVTSDGKDNGNYSLTDLVAEFEPGKPWKGTSTMKSAEDDPHLTPGSVVRSPLSLNTIKDPELFGGWKHNSPGGGGAANEGSLAASLASLTSSTWAFTPAMHGNSSSSMNKQGSKSSWGSIGSEHQQQHQHVQQPNSDPWGAPHKNTRGPPPGIPSSSQGWDQNSCTFLVLKNLTPQIDGSTLKTLCMQHGPLQLFHLFLKHGLALAQYSSREEAAKAQSALHNCILSNTTMLAYIPTEAEVAQFLQLANSSAPHTWPAASSYAPPRPQAPPPVSSSAAPSFAPTRQKPADAPWNLGGSSHLWSFPGGGGGLWAAPPLSGVGPGSSDHDHPSSSLHSFLPGDLLSGESM